MKGPRISARVVIKYTLLQIPGTVLLVMILILLQRWMSLSSYLFWGIVGVWVAKEIILFPFVWRAYDSRGGEAGRAMLGRKGIAEETLNPSGYMRIGGELWRAEILSGEPAIEKGEGARVRDIRGLTLLVEAERPEKNT